MVQSVFLYTVWSNVTLEQQSKYNENTSRNNDRSTQLESAVESQSLTHQYSAVKNGPPLTYMSWSWHWRAASIYFSLPTSWHPFITLFSLPLLPSSISSLCVNVSFYTHVCSGEIYFQFSVLYFFILPFQIGPIYKYKANSSVFLLSAPPNHYCLQWKVFIGVKIKGHLGKSS